MWNGSDDQDDVGEEGSLTKAVLSGGPGGGKSTSLVSRRAISSPIDLTPPSFLQERIRLKFEPEGVLVMAVPETATILLVSIALSLLDIFLSSSHPRITDFPCFN